MKPTERLVLDTSAYSHLCAGRSEVLEFVAGAAVVVMPVTVLGEDERCLPASGLGFVIGVVQCGLIYVGLRRMGEASDERKSQHKETMEAMFSGRR